MLYVRLSSQAVYLLTLEGFHYIVVPQVCRNT